MSQKKAPDKKKPSSPPEAAADPSTSSADRASQACLRLGWTMITAFLFLGLVLESFHLVKLPFYLDVHLRRELWTLAHAHGTLLGAINVLFGLSATRMMLHAGRRETASKLLRFGSLLVPAGFLLGGIANTEGDPSLFIFLVPTGALLALLGLGLLVLARR